MRVFLFPFFLLRLALAVSPTLLRTLTLSWPPLTPLFSSLIFTWIIVSSYAWQTTPGDTTLVGTESKSEMAQQLTPSLSTLEKELRLWETVLGQQPTHRDALINLALLNEALGNQEKASEYWNRARELDPNSPLFNQK